MAKFWVLQNHCLSRDFCCSILATLPFYLLISIFHSSCYSYYYYHHQNYIFMLLKNIVLRIELYLCTILLPLIVLMWKHYGSVVSTVILNTKYQLNCFEWKITGHYVCVCYQAVFFGTLTNSTNNNYNNSNCVQDSSKERKESAVWPFTKFCMPAFAIIWGRKWNQEKLGSECWVKCIKEAESIHLKFKLYDFFKK